MRTIETFCLTLVLLAGCTGDETIRLPDDDSAAPDTDIPGDTSDTGDTGVPQNAACPTFAPLDRDGAWWTYDVGGQAMTFTATGATVWNDLTVYGQHLDMSEYGVEMMIWYTCEVDGLHQAGIDVEMSGDVVSMFFDPQPLLMPADPHVGDTWSTDYTIYEESGGASHLAAYAGEGVADTFRGRIDAVETLELESGMFESWVLDFEQQGTPDRMWWSEGIGYVRQGIVPENMDLVQYGPM